MAAEETQRGDWRVQLFEEREFLGDDFVIAFALCAGERLIEDRIGSSRNGGGNAAGLRPVLPRIRVPPSVPALKSDFWKAWDQVAKPAPWEDCTTIVPSSTKIENFVVSSPCPGFSRWLGARN